MKKATTLHDILGDFTPTQPDQSQYVKSGGSVSIWLPAEFKARYDRLQEVSGKRFSKKVREAMQLLIALAEER